MELGIYHLQIGNFMINDSANALQNNTIPDLTSYVHVFF